MYGEAWPAGELDATGAAMDAGSAKQARTLSIGMAVLSNSSFCVTFSSKTLVKLYLHGA